MGDQLEHALREALRVRAEPPTLATHSAAYVPGVGRSEAAPFLIPKASRAALWGFRLLRRWPCWRFFLVLCTIAPRAIRPTSASIAPVGCWDTNVRFQFVGSALYNTSAMHCEPEQAHRARSPVLFHCLLGAKT